MVYCFCFAIKFIKSVFAVFYYKFVRSGVVFLKNSFKPFKLFVSFFKPQKAVAYYESFMYISFTILNISDMRIESLVMSFMPLLSMFL